MLKTLGIFCAGFILGVVTALFVDTTLRLRDDSALMMRWVRFRIWVLSVWERKWVYFLIVAACILAGLLVGNLNILPGIESGRGGGWF